MAMHHLTLPPTRESVADIRVGDIVYLTGDIVVTGGLPAHKRIVEYLDAGKELPIEMGGVFIHLPHMVEEKPDGSWTIHYVNPTTSTRFNNFLPRFIRDLDLHILGGKGGVGEEAVEAMRENGCIYVSILGGGSPIMSECIKEVRQVEWREFPAHFRLSRLRVENLGPLTVGVDAHGGSIYDALNEQARDRLPEILAQLDRRRAEAAGA